MINTSNHSDRIPEGALKSTRAPVLGLIYALKLLFLGLVSTGKQLNESENSILLPWKRFPNGSNFLWIEELRAILRLDPVFSLCGRPTRV